MTDGALTGQQIIRRSFATALRLYVGRGRPISVVALSETTGIPEATLKTYVAETASPGLENLLALMRELPPGFADSVLGLIGLAASPIDPRPRHPAGVLADMAGGVALFAEAMRDGRIDHLEEVQIAAEARRVAAELQALAADLERRRSLR
jgi:hypothetical protein